jgi:hypothetical protein
VTRRTLTQDRPTGPPNPFEACTFAACIMVGLATVIPSTRPASFQEVLPTWGLNAWGVLMFMGGTAALTGLYWPKNPMDGVLIKRVGLMTLGPLTIAYGIAGLATDPHTRFVAAGFAFSIGIACLWRTRQVTVAIRDFHRQLRGLREEWRSGGGP